MEQLTIQSLGFPIGFPIGFQEDIKIIKIIIIIIIIIVIIIIIIVVIVIIVIMVIMVSIVILACPDARCESGQSSGSCRTSIVQVKSPWLLVTYRRSNGVSRKYEV